MLTSWGEPSYRADQLWCWLYRSFVTDFKVMTDLPKEIREKLAERAYIKSLEPLEEVASEDGSTFKVLFSLWDGQTIESVLMLYNRRRTVCVSTQVGCPIGCPFCATGKMGFVRNLTPGEIVEQVLYFCRKSRKRITNVVLMGMGEPFLNYEATWQAIEALNDPRGFNLGARKITISTVGIVPGIERLSRERLQVGLAVSLHAPNDEIRGELVPINSRYPIENLMKACREYVERTGRRITFEYALMDGVNDSVWQARQLAKLLRGLLCHINLIPLNPVEGSPFRPSPKRKVLAFQEELNKRGIPTTLRVRRGVEIQAGCGQLMSRGGKW